jgi:probable F420-dependent oxidoreductase
MSLGLYGLQTDQSLPFATLASEAEHRGFDSVYTSEHSHVPIGPDGARPAGAPASYSRLLDPFSALASAAPVTREIRLGTGLCLAGLHDPIRLAKIVSTLDLLSDGRFVFGAGYGSLAGEMTNHGVAPRQVREVFHDKMLAMRQIWSQDVAAHEGPYVSFSGVEQYPKPRHGNRPPTLLGTKLSNRSTSLLVEFYDGWMPISGAPAEALSLDIATLRRALSDAGRDPAAFEVILFYVPPRTGLPNDGEWLRAYQRAGVDTLCLPVPSKRDGALPRLDSYGEYLKVLSAAAV